MSIGPAKNGGLHSAGRPDPASPKVRLSQLRKLRECEQVAAVCYRVRNGELEFLLVQTGGGRWTFPKGGVEPGLTHAQSAAFEAFEEAGVHGRMEQACFARYSNRDRGSARRSSKFTEKSATVLAYLCEVLRLSRPQEPNRNRTWFPVQKAKRRLGEERSREGAAEFARVVDRAVARIERLYSAPATGSNQTDGPEIAPQRGDALQKVLFEAAEIARVHGRMGEASLVRYAGRRSVGLRRPPQLSLP